MTSVPVPVEMELEEPELELTTQILTQKKVVKWNLKSVGVKFGKKKVVGQRDLNIGQKITGTTSLISSAKGELMIGATLKLTEPEEFGVVQYSGTLQFMGKNPVALLFEKPEYKLNEEMVSSPICMVEQVNNSAPDARGIRLHIRLEMITKLNDTKESEDEGPMDEELINGDDVEMAPQNVLPPEAETEKRPAVFQIGGFRKKRKYD